MLIGELYGRDIPLEAGPLQIATARAGPRRWHAFRSEPSMERQPSRHPWNRLKGTKKVKQRVEASSMNIGPKMAFILRVYQMTDSENAEDLEHDRELVRAGVMSARTYNKRRCTRDLARRIRRRDDTGNWPRDVRKKADNSVIVRGHILQ